MARPHEGQAHTARGRGHFLRETIGWDRSAGMAGELTIRADSGFYGSEVVRVCRTMGVRFSITVRQYTSIRHLIEAIPEDAWTPMPYWLNDGAYVAETTYISFPAERDAVRVRLIVRRVKPIQGSQLGLLTLCRDHLRAGHRDEVVNHHRE